MKGFTLITCILSVSGCSLFQSQVAKTVVDLAFATCVQEAESVDEQEVARICNVGPDAFDVLRKLLAAKRVGIARVSARRTDAGAP